MTQNAELVPTIESAGYQLVQEHKILTTHGIWEFRRAKVGGRTGIRI